MSMDVEIILSKFEKEVKNQITRSKIKINRFVSKYNDVIRCFYTDDETDDLYDLLFDISVEYDIPEEEVYYMFVESKYTTEGELCKTVEDDFAVQITLFIINNQ